MRPNGLVVRIATSMGLGPCAMRKVSPRFGVKSHRFVEEGGGEMDGA